MISIFLKSVLIGMCAAIPLGPTAILCVQRTLSKGYKAGHAVGVGSSFGDTFYALIAITSVTFISSFLDDHKGWVLVVGGFIIMVIGALIAGTNPAHEISHIQSKKDKKNRKKKEVQLQDHKDEKRSTLLTSASQGFVMTMSNPGALVLMLGVVAFFELDIQETCSSVNAILLALAGVITGSNIWWFILSNIINKFREKVRISQLIAINRIAGVVIGVLGTVSLVQGILQLVQL